MKKLHPMDEWIVWYYTKEYPDDECGSRLQAGATFRDMMKAIRARIDIYLIMGTGDSIIRERLFAELSRRSGKSYDWIYNCWLYGPQTANDMKREGLIK